MLDIKNIYKNFGNLKVLEGVSTQIEEGEVVAIIGASGSGKSTLLHICAGLDKPNYGKVIIRGTDITALSPDKLGRFRGEFTGMVFQKHNLIPQLTALENILVPTVMCDRASFKYEEHIKKLIRTLRLEDRLHHLPSELSGGQQQRVAIARAMINRPQVLFCDEPTGNLDRKNADEVLELLLETKALIGQTLIMVTHDMSIADRADKIYIMDDGKLELFKDRQGFYRNSFEADMKRAKAMNEHVIQPD